jgi:hypothetical protein
VVFFKEKNKHVCSLKRLLTQSSLRVIRIKQTKRETETETEKGKEGRLTCGGENKERQVHYPRQTEMNSTWVVEK